jgi:hypothetical protein
MPRPRLQTRRLELIAGIDRVGYAKGVGAADTVPLLAYRLDAPAVRRVKLANALQKCALVAARRCRTGPLDQHRRISPNIAITQAVTSRVNRVNRRAASHPAGRWSQGGRVLVRAIAPVRSGTGSRPDRPLGALSSRQLGLSLASIVTDPDSADLTGVTNFGPRRPGRRLRPPPIPRHHRLRPRRPRGVTDLGPTGSAVRWWAPSSRSPS